MKNEESSPNDGLEFFIGKIIDKIVVGEEGNDFITFWINDIGYIYNVEQQCCSTSWVESIEGAEYLIGEQVIDIIEHQMPHDDTKEFSIHKQNDIEENDCLKVYNCDIKTWKGICTIDFRNSSNGYYGASLLYYGNTATSDPYHDYMKPSIPAMMYDKNRVSTLKFL